MSMNKILTFFAPKDRKFYALFTQNADNLLATAEALKTLFHTPKNGEWKALIEEIERLEHIGDDITHKIFTQLSLNFITPFDREDIHYLASAMDDVVDYIQAAAQRLELMHIEEITPPMRDLADVVEKCASEVHLAVIGLQEMNYNKTKEILVRIHSLENQADELFDKSISDLYQNEKNAIELLKKQQMIDILETATDKCEDVANVVESILLKYA
ncbi:MAG: DUF47 domain-containing protein [Saprospiraceae bacterium]|nr:DUF47 domain-containing protein [Saprospiraceae bacterium]